MWKTSKEMIYNIWIVKGDEGNQSSFEQNIKNSIIWPRDTNFEKKIKMSKDK